MTTTGQSLWQSLFFIVLTLLVGLAFPILLFLVLPVLILAGGWILRQPNRTPVDVFAGRTAIALSGAVIVMIVGIIIIGRVGYQQYTSSTTLWGSGGQNMIIYTDPNPSYFVPEVTPESTETPIEPTKTPLE